MFVGYFCPPRTGSGYWSRDPIESGSNPDPDPRHCLSWCFFIYVYSVEDGTNERAAGERASVEEEENNTPMEVDLEQEEDLLSRGTESTINKRTGVVTDRWEIPWIWTLEEMIPYSRGQSPQYKKGGTGVVTYWWVNCVFLLFLLDDRKDPYP